MRLDSSGRLGLGTSAPGQLLHVANGSAWIGAPTSSSSGTVGIYGDGNNATIEVFAGNNSSTKRNLLLCPYGGSVGIGTLSASVPLTIQADSNAFGTDIIGRAADNTSIIRFKTTDNATALGSIGQYGTTMNIATVGAGPIAFYTTNTERGRWDSSGSFLVGTPSALTTISDQPRVQVFVGDQGAASYIRGSANEFGPNIHLAKTRSTTPGVYSVLQSGDELGSIFFIGDDGSDLNQTGARISAAVDGTPGANVMPGRLVFSTTSTTPGASPTERMRIANNGAVTIGHSDQSAPSPAGVSLFANGAQHIGNNAGGTGWGFINFYRSTVFLGNISQNGTTGVSYNTSSDYRLKENVVPLTGAADRLNQLQVRRFNFIADPDITVDGFLAHEAQAVVPECVTGEKDAVDDDGNPVYQGIDQSKLVPLLTAALQEAIAEIETLKARLTAAGI
jgi:hypothetical protein